jgi:hypothetical protein
MNNRLTDKLIKMGVTDPKVAHKIIEHYLKTGKLVKLV